MRTTMFIDSLKNERLERALGNGQGFVSAYTFWIERRQRSCDI